MSEGNDRNRKIRKNGLRQALVIIRLIVKIEGKEKKSSGGKNIDSRYENIFILKYISERVRSHLY